MEEITPSQIIQWVGMGIGLIGVWYRNSFRIERMEEKYAEHKESDDKKHIELERQKDALWAWIDTHEKDSGNTRETLNKEISEIRGENRVHGEQFKQVLGLLTEIKERLARLENRN